MEQLDEALVIVPIAHPMPEAYAYLQGAFKSQTIAKATAAKLTTRSNKSNTGNTFQAAHRHITLTCIHAAV